MSVIKSSKVVVMGDMSVGKTSILTRYITDTFDSLCESTIGAAFFTKCLDGSNGKKLNLEIWDTAGQERYDSLLPMYYRNANIIIFIFDINNFLSFKNLETRWLPIIQNCKTDAQVFIVGNKSDLTPVVKDDDVFKLIEPYGAIEYFKVSAKNNTGLHELFKSVYDNVISKNLYKEVATTSANISIPVKKKNMCC